MTPSVRVLVSASCAGCAQALALARDLARERPGLQVQVVDVGDPAWSPPPGFSGTPMFYLGDSVISYGNPTLAQLLAAADRQVT